MTYHYPLISCVMPTRNRRRFIPGAIRSFLSQTYQNKELIICDNGEDCVADLIPEGVPIYYYHVGEKRLSTGAMRNECNHRVNGKMIAHFDDDDYSHPKRLFEQHKLMLSMSVSVVGYNEMYFIDDRSRKAWIYRNPELYAIGTSLMYTIEYWKAHRFQDVAVAEDTEFIESAQYRRAMSVRAAGDRLVARNHAENTCQKTYLSEPMWIEVSYALVEAMIPVESRVPCESVLSLS